MSALQRVLLILVLLAPAGLSCGGGEQEPSAAGAPSTENLQGAAGVQSQGIAQEGLTGTVPGQVASPQEPEIDPTAQAFLEVRTFLNGQPIGNISFDVHWVDEGAPSKTASRTEPSGVRRIPFDHGAELLRVLSQPSPMTAPLTVTDKAFLQGGRTRVVELNLVDGAIVSGTVFDVEGNPVPNADVLAFFDTPENLDKKEAPTVRSYTKTNAQGTFRLGGLPGGPFVLEAAAEGQGTVWRPGGLIHTSAEIKDLEILMEPIITIYGQVLNELDEPVDGVKIVAGGPGRRRVRRPTPNPEVFHYQARARNTHSVEDGTFQLVGVPESRGWMINATHPEYKRSIQVTEPGQIDVWVEMTRGINLRGTVRDVAGAAIGQAQLWMLTSDGESSAFSEFDGTFLFGGLDPLGEVYMIVYKPGAGMGLVGPMAIMADMADVDIVLDNSLSLEGRVVDAQGQVVSGAGVRIEGDLPAPGFPSSRLPERFLDLYAVLTSSDGSFRFDELYANSFTVTVTAPGHAKLVVEKVRPGGEILELQLAD